MKASTTVKVLSMCGGHMISGKYQDPSTEFQINHDGSEVKVASFNMPTFDKRIHFNIKFRYNRYEALVQW